jgi:16S rRNA A1518/A1519 N6-dimethyltransferase RsmA/KsgA/DIM1 with predicted DNA glycosylase/AP lyase activity
VGGRAQAGGDAAVDRALHRVGTVVGRRIPARAFRPVPRVDAAMLHVARRQPPILPPRMAADYVDFVERRWQ